MPAARHAVRRLWSCRTVLIWSIGMPEHPPALFERVPRGLFGPLGDLYAELYWDLLAELYRHEFEREPFVVVRSTALDIADAVIRGSRSWNERRQDLEVLAREDAALSRERQGI